MSQLIDQHILNLAFSGLQMGVGVYDKEGRLTTCNEEFKKMKSAYLIGDELLKEVVRKGKSERRLLTGHDGMVLEAFISPYSDEKGETAGYVYRLANVSSGEAPSKEKHLEEIFLDNVSHEIRTPLNSIVGFCDLLNGVTGKHLEETEKLVMKDHIHRNANRLLMVVNDVLDLSKMQKGCLTLHKTVVSLMEVCYKARESVKHEMSPNVKLQHEYPVALKDTYIYTDGKRLEQLLRIFLENACQHTGEGCVTLKVKTFESSETGRDMLQLRVDDTGEGIAPDQYDLLFKPFRKLDRKSEGLGVGLAICKEIARLLDGRVYFNDDYLEGASFVFEMPFEEV